MSDKVQKIKEEIERQIEEGKVKCQQSQENNDYESFVAWSEHVATCGKLLVFINSLPEEPASEDLEEEIERFLDENENIPSYSKTARHFAEWGRNHFEYKSEITSEDLEEAAKEYSFNIPTQLEADSVWKKETEQHFKDGSYWKENKMAEALQTEYEKGLFDMREEIMKNTVLETKVMMDSDGDGIETPYEEWLTLENTEILYIPDELGLKEGDKVQIIIVKTEQQ